MIRRIPGAWSRFWFARVDPLPLAVLRVGVAVSGIYLWAGMIPVLRRYYSDLGEFPLSAAREWSTEWAARVLLPGFAGSYGVVLALAVVYLAMLIAMLVGYRTRIATIAVAVLTQFFFFRNPTLANGGDEVLRLVTFSLALAFLAVPVHARAMSLDRRIAIRRNPPAPVGPPAPVPAWTLRLVQVQVGIVYLVAGFWKVMGRPWWDGSALYYALDNATFSRFGVPHAPWLHWFYVPLTVSVAWWEFLFPLLVSLRRTRVPALLFGVMLHVFILVAMNIGVFPVIMLACYPAFFRGAELRAAGRWVAARLLRGHVRETPSPAESSG